MAHTISRRKLRGLAMASPLAHFRGWRLLAACPACGDGPRSVGLAVVLARRSDLTVCRAVQMLRCSRCGARPRMVRLEPPRGSRNSGIVLAGPGAS